MTSTNGQGLDCVGKTKENQTHPQPGQSSDLPEHDHLPFLRLVPKMRQHDIAPEFPPAWIFAQRFS
jgi:hypothetical protein